VQSWNFTVEQRIKGWIASAGYVASRAVDPVAALNLNWSPIGTGTAGQRLNVLARRTAITNTVGTMGTNKYDSLQARLQHQFARGLQINANYTFAKAEAYSTQVAIPEYFRLNYGAASNIAHHTLGLAGIADSPFGRGKAWLQNGPAAWALGGWQLNAVAVLRSGTPFTVTASNTTLNAVASSQFADCVSTPQKLGSIYQWYDKSAFAAPSAGRFGTCGTNSLWGPRLINMDLGLDRNFRLTERFQLKVRVETFNLTNTPHHSNPTNSINSGTFMQALGIANTGREGIDERTFRLSLRVGW
jgi:hypothetical protein